VLETIFLDAGGVLVFPNWQRVSDALKARGVEVDPAALAVAEPHVKRQIDVEGVIQATRDRERGWIYFDLILERVGVQPSVGTRAALEELHAYHDRHNLWEYVPGDVLPSLRELRSLGLQLVIVSNANGTVLEAAERLGLTECVGCVLDSHVEGVEKPDPRFFELALARSGARRETTIHVGDIYQVDVVGARAAGIRPVLFDAAGLYPDADCARVASLPALVEAVRRGEFGPRP
jgi:putative hydrolase of the HAD superfamily